MFNVHTTAITTDVLYPHLLSVSKVPCPFAGVPIIVADTVNGLRITKSADPYKARRLEAFWHIPDLGLVEKLGTFMGFDVSRSAVAQPVHNVSGDAEFFGDDEQVLSISVSFQCLIDPFAIFSPFFLILVLALEVTFSHVMFIKNLVNSLSGDAVSLSHVSHRVNSLRVHIDYIVHVIKFSIGQGSRKYFQLYLNN